MSAKLDKLHARHVLPGFDDKSEEEGEIERITSEITNVKIQIKWTNNQQFHECQRQIKDVQRQAKGLIDTEAIMAKNIQISLATKVQESSTMFRKKQASYLRRLGGNERSSTPSFWDDTSAPDYDVSISQSALRQQQSQRRTNDVAIAQREREIEDIAKGIIELSEIFKELQTMVIDQGTMLDRIDYNVEMTRDRVKGAQVDLGAVFSFP
jgi:syntaxin 16